MRLFLNSSSGVKICATAALCGTDSTCKAKYLFESIATLASAHPYTFETIKI
jgi:hypothetical protein